MTTAFSFPGGAAVDVQPQPPGSDSAMSPFDVFFFSTDTCLVPMNGAGVPT